MIFSPIKKPVGRNVTGFRNKLKHSNYIQNLIDPEGYYAQVFPRVAFRAEWVKVNCPFHDDRTPSLSINVRHGGFICRGECRMSGNLIQFHMKIKGLKYKAALKDLECGL